MRAYTSTCRSFFVLNKMFIFFSRTKYHAFKEKNQCNNLFEEQKCTLMGG